MGNKTKNNKGRSTKKFTAKESRLKDKRRHTRALSRKMDEILKDVTGKTADELPIEFNEQVNKLLSENKHTKNMSRLRLPTNEKEYNDYLRKNQKPHSEHDWRESYGNDRLLLERHEAVRSNAKDIVDTYLYYCSIDKRNINIIFDSMKQRGWDGDVGRAFSEFEDTVPDSWEGDSTNIDNMHRGYSSFLSTMRMAQIFAFPQWWFDTALKQWRNKSIESYTQDSDFPFHGGNEFDLSQWYSDLRNSGRTDEEIEAFGDELSDRNWKHISTYDFPEEMPFRTMFVGFEREQKRKRTNHGYLMYQRRLDQSQVCTEWGVPTSAFAPDLESPIPLDLIYLDGILWDGARQNWSVMPDTDSERWSMFPKDTPVHLDVIWGLCSGYVISREHCPAGMMFRRIPMAVPLYLKFTNGEPMFLHGDKFGNEIDLPRTGWVQPDNFHAPTLQSVITAIDEHRAIKERFTLKQRKKRNSTNRKNRSEMGDDAPEITHKNYQRVQMSQSVEIDVGAVSSPSNGILSLPKWKLNHRVSIRSHERVKVQRGIKPLSDHDRKWLIDHEYRIYETPGEITRKDYQRLKFRKKAIADHTHWVAVKHMRVKEHERGPKDSPIVKVVRVPDGSVASGALSDDLTHGE